MNAATADDSAARIARATVQNAYAEHAGYDALTTLEKVMDARDDQTSADILDLIEQAAKAGRAEALAIPSTDSREAVQKPCTECGEATERDDVHAAHGMCGSCLHDAYRSGWTPGDDN